MLILQSLQMALKQIFARKMRSFLTMLGIIIGVASVILLVSLGKSVSYGVNQQLGDLGSNLITVYNNSTSKTNQLDLQEVMEYKDIEGVAHISPEIDGSANVLTDQGGKAFSIVGTNEQFKQVHGAKLAKGRFLSPVDVDNNQKIAIIGHEVATELFGFGNPVNQTIKLNGYNYKVVGVLKKSGESLLGSTDKQIILPITSAERLLKNQKINTVYVQASSADKVNFVISILKSRLSLKFENETKNSDSPVFQIVNQKELLDTFDTVNALLTNTLGAIAAISLVVGGIGIMNIMLVSVQERTKEIGIRKALGAKRSTILIQFLIESAVISVTGGIIGIVIGSLGSMLFSAVADVPSGVSAGVISFAFIFALVVGIVFGISPANKAARCKPVDALASM
ncbi:FtsX-like permease family protein [Listeria aquatica]|uniref:FtsX-like permease family protein n=1 Tax=Listeria aquatica TaxID=1494960 RepID=A0A841ZTW0_9LIST|nr:ABC transporter permease [Listeria aquatica]MBC1522350.1 FtsX-like permease family protein [Listeria aquatica]